jgi:hypothetical protein
VVEKFSGFTHSDRLPFEEYRFNAVFPHSDGRVEDPDGQLVMIYDEDAGF